MVALVSFVNKFVHELLTVGVVKASGTRPFNSKGRCRETISEAAAEGGLIDTLVIMSPGRD
jgi:hypothetical protein